MSIHTSKTVLFGGTRELIVRNEYPEPVRTIPNGAAYGTELPDGSALVSFYIPAEIVAHYLALSEGTDPIDAAIMASIVGQLNGREISLLRRIAERFPMAAMGIAKAVIAEQEQPR